MDERVRSGAIVRGVRERGACVCVGGGGRGVCGGLEIGERRFREVGR